MTVCLFAFVASLPPGKAVVLDPTPDTAKRLPRAMLVLDQAEANVACAKFTKANTARHRHTGPVVLQCADGRYLYRREHAVIEIGFDARQRPYQRLVATAKTDPPASAHR
jgi:hypothetical protein